MPLPDTFLDFKSNKEDPYLSTCFCSIVPPFAKIQYFLFDKYLIFTMTIPIPSSVLRLQTGVPTDTIARRIRVKRVGRDDGARGIRRSSRSRSRMRERQGKNKSSAPCYLSLRASHGYGVQSRL